jgi:L-threonylcarbamoyladenylate synthase
MLNAQQWRIKLVARQLREGAVIAYPTEGVWGLGCLPEYEASVQRILNLKKRTWKQGLILVAASFDQARPYMGALSADEMKTLKQHWPGPITYLIPRSSKVADWVAGESDKVAIRVSGLDLIQQICNKVGSPIISTSANPAGKPPAKDLLRLRQYFPTGIDYIFPGSIKSNGASEIRDLGTGAVIRKASK